MSAAPADLNGSLQGWGQVANVLATLLIGYIAFKVAVQSKGIAAASILPFLVVDEELYADRLCWNIKNVGLGPAIIKQVEVTYPAEPYIVRCVKELAASDRQKLETFLNHPAVNALAGGLPVGYIQPVGFIQPVDQWARQALQRMPVAGQTTLQLLDDGYTHWFDPAQPTTKCYAEAAQSDPKVLDQWPLPPLRTANARGYLKLASNRLQKMVNMPVAPQGKLPFYTAELKDNIPNHPPNNPPRNGTIAGKQRPASNAPVNPPDPAAAVWQVFRLKLLGHINDIQLTIRYSNALKNSVEPLRFPFYKNFDSGEVAVLREAVGLPSEQRLADLLQDNPPDLQANIKAVRELLPTCNMVLTPPQPVPAAVPAAQPGPAVVASKWMRWLKNFLQQG